MSKDSEYQIRLPVGYDSFAEIIEKKLSFIDKSLFIKEVLDDAGAEVSVITRPRRFGKTLNLSMLHHFLAPEVMGQPTRGLWDNLKITQCGEAIMNHQGKYPVISLTFKDVKETDFNVALLRFSKLMSDLYNQYHFLLESDKLNPNEKINFPKRS